jgi:hypothetical protein
VKHLSVLSTCTWLFYASSVFGQQPTAADKAAATQLFEDAEKLLAARNLSEACSKYAESQRLEPQLGTLLHLADCFEKMGKTASAWAHFKEAIELAARRGDSREATAKARAAALEPKLSRMELSVPAALPPDVEIRQDDNVVGRAAWGSAMPVDPGVHVISAKASGYKPWKTSVQVAAEGARVRVSVPPLEAESSARSASLSTSETPVVPTTAPSESTGSTQRIIGYAVGGVGLVAVGVGIGFFVQRSSKIEERDAVPCPNNVCKPEDAARVHELQSEAESASTAGLVATIAGGAALAGGAVLILTAPRAAPATGWNVRPWVGLGGGGMTAALRF